MDKVFVWGPGAFDYEMMFSQNGFRLVKSVTEADIVCWTGGEDVNPELYGETKLPGTGINAERDDEDLTMFSLAEGKFKVGICRGGQFLNVVNGGRMFQDVDGHGRTHKVFDVHTGQDVMCTSTHHQMMIPTPDAILIGTARESHRKVGWFQSWQYDASRKDDPFKEDIEVVYYPMSKSLCFQPHPELMSAPKECTRWFFEVLDRCRHHLED